MTKNVEKETALAGIAEKIGVNLILLFGSRADGSNRPDSDFDIAYRSKTPLDSDADGELFTAVSTYVGSDNLHILNLRGIKPLTLYEIMRNCKVLYAQDLLDFYELRVYAIRRFEDEVKPLYDIIFNRLKKQYAI